MSLGDEVGADWLYLPEASDSRQASGSQKEGARRTGEGGEALLERLGSVREALDPAARAISAGGPDRAPTALFCAALPGMRIDLIITRTSILRSLFYLIKAK